jgi:DNA adenine methylase
MHSPLRYPGGKAKLFKFFIDLVERNSLFDHVYAEPFAGGAGLALRLLGHGYVNRIELNDADPAIYSFWRSALFATEELCRLVRDTPISVDEWRRQRSVYQAGSESGELDLGFAAFFLNRTSRSGIIEGSGPIGGYSQNSVWKIDARFQRDSQIMHISEIAKRAPDISISCLDAIDFCKPRFHRPNVFMYLDPPYFVKGKKLYKNYYTDDDHAEIADMLRSNRSGKWVLSYDFVPRIAELYQDFQPVVYDLSYSAGRCGRGREVMYASDSMQLRTGAVWQVAA